MTTGNRSFGFSQDDKKDFIEPQGDLRLWTQGVIMLISPLLKAADSGPVLYTLILFRGI